MTMKMVVPTQNVRINAHILNNDDAKLDKVETVINSVFMLPRYGFSNGGDQHPTILSQNGRMQIANFYLLYFLTHPPSWVE